jgi:hypothetical protein
VSRSCSDRCLNTAHAWQLGWVAPQVLDGASLPPGGTVSATIAAQTRSPNSGLKIRLSSWAAADNIYVGYRWARLAPWCWWEGLWRDQLPLPRLPGTCCTCPGHLKQLNPDCRLAEGGDATLGSDYRGRVNVYQ